jgi:hypothetical protein
MPRLSGTRSPRPAGCRVAGILLFATLARCARPGPTAPVAQGEPSLSVVSFTMNEILDQGWSYAPLVTLAETGGAADAWVVKVVFEIPGLGAFQVGYPEWRGAVVPRGGTAELFPRGSSDDVRSWELTLDSGQFARSSSGEAFATVHFVDGLDRLDSLTVRGPVVPASPATASAGALGCSGRCG